MRDVEPPSESTGPAGIDDPPESPGARRRGGRPPSTASRDRIRAVARAAFAANGYDGTSLRGVARDAGVDPSLVVQLFGGKAGLFAAVIEWPIDPAELRRGLTQEAPEDVGAYVARQFIARWDHDEHRNPILSMIQAAMTDAAAAQLLREFIVANLALPAVQRAGGDQPALRAALFASQLLGFGLARYVIAFGSLHEATSEELVHTLGASLQYTCTGPLGPGAEPGARRAAEATRR